THIPIPPRTTLFPYTTLFRSREDDADRNQVVLGEEARKRLTEHEEEGRARHRPHERSHPAHHVEDHRFAGDEEQDEAVIFNVMGDRKSTRLNSSHRTISYAVF